MCAASESVLERSPVSPSSPIKGGAWSRGSASCGRPATSSSDGYARRLVSKTSSRGTCTCVSCGTSKISAHISVMRPSDLALYARSCAWTLAGAHARCSDSTEIAGYPGFSEVFDRAITAFCQGRLKSGPVTPVEKWTTLPGWELIRALRGERPSSRGRARRAKAVCAGHGR